MAPSVAEEGISPIQFPGDSSFISRSPKSSEPSALNESTTFLAFTDESSVALIWIGLPCAARVTGSWVIASAAGVFASPPPFCDSTAWSKTSWISGVASSLSSLTSAAISSAFLNSSSASSFCLKPANRTTPR